MSNTLDKFKTALKEYGISSAFATEILGFGQNTLLNYYKGKVPDKSHALAMTIASTPYGMKSYLDICSKSTKERKEFPKLYLKVQGMCFDIDKKCEELKNQMNENYFNNK